MCTKEIIFSRAKQVYVSGVFAFACVIGNVRVMNGLKHSKMGQNASLPRQRRLSFRSPFLRRSKLSQKNSLSHTFTFLEDGQVPELLNINFATEEELMTLPGITRNVARSIVEHRKAIGRFKKVEDLALVRGIGADKLELIRPEICASKTISSSRVPSVDSLKSTDSCGRFSKLVNINKATVFELQCVQGITQEMAASIVLYRSKKGPFKQIDDLIKVKNVDAMRLSNIRHYLTVDSHEYKNGDVGNYSNGFVQNGYQNGSANGDIHEILSHVSTRPRRRSALGPVKINGTNGVLPSSLQDIYELLSAYSSRPMLEEEFTYSHNKKPAIRIGTWNLHQLSLEKAHNLGVKEVICRTILENGWSILAVQEVQDVDALKLICEELNNPTLHRIIDWKRNSKSWHFCMLNANLGFIYDSFSGGLNIDLHFLEELTVEEVPTLHCELSVNGLKLSLLNLQLHDGLELEKANKIITETISQSDSLIILGDFRNILLEKTEVCKELGGLTCVLPVNTNTGIQHIKVKYSDNILLTQNVQTKLTGSWGLVKNGLTHLAIPNGWSWGGPASPHCPLWVEIYTNPINGRIL